MSQYFLSPGVYARIVDSNVIFLDLKRDRYLGLDADRTAEFTSLLHGSSDDLEVLAAELKTRGLIAERPEPRLLAAEPLETMDESLMGPSDDEPPPRLTVRDILAFIGSCISIYWSLKLCSPYRAFTRHWKLGQRRGLRPAHSCRARTERLVRVFRHLRPLVYRSADNCMYDSLVLGEFLRRRGLRARCVIGVRAGPFGAHCWIQSGRMALNGSPQFLHGFHPILAA